MAKASESMRKSTTNGHAPRIEPLFNSAFARIFGREESKPLTRGLVNAVLKRIGVEPIGIIDWIDAEHTAVGGSVSCKTPRMDIRIIAPGRVVDVEAQGYPEDLENRSLFYGAQLLCENMFEGTPYSELPQAIVITLLDAPSLFPEAEGFVHACQMRWRVDGGDDADATDRMLFAVVELEKVRKRYNRLDKEVLADEQINAADNRYVNNKPRGITMVHEITDETFEAEVANSPAPCVIQFTAGFCTYCDKMTPVFEELSEKFGDAVKFCLVNTDHNKKLRIKFAVAAYPYVVLVADGTQTPLFDEFVSADRLEERIRFVLDGGKAPTTRPL